MCQSSAGWWLHLLNGHMEESDEPRVHGAVVSGDFQPPLVRSAVISESQLGAGPTPRVRCAATLQQLQEVRGRDETAS